MALLSTPTPARHRPTTSVPAQPTHPQERLRAAGKLWGSPTGPYSGLAPGPAAGAASAAHGGPPRPLRHSPQGPQGHPAAPGSQPAPQGSPRARAKLGLSPGRPQGGAGGGCWDEGGGGSQVKTHLDRGLPPLAALKAQGPEHTFQDSNCRR